MKCRTPLKAAVCGFLFAQLPLVAAGAVTVTENSAFYSLDNGIVTAVIAKDSGDLVSLKYKGMEMTAHTSDANGQLNWEKDPPGENLEGLNATMTDHQYGFWSHDAMGVRGTAPAAAKITIDPKSNNGARAEVSVKGVSNNRKMGTGPGANTYNSGDGNFVADVEIRYAMDKDTAGVYTYCVFEHQPNYDATTITEARFAVKLADMFDWMLVDNNPHRNKLYPKEARENKYDYTVVQYDHPAYGWASTAKNVGCFILNPDMEYMSGGPTKVEFLCHRDTNAIAAPTILNYWRSSHYGGAGVSVAAGEHWSKVIGPFMIYVNSGADHEAMYRDAQAMQAKEAAKWPYEWVNGVDYPHKAERANVTGQLVLNDPVMPSARMSHLMVGLAHPDYPNAGGFGGTVTWQTDAKNYEFWVRGDDQGRFSIPNVRAGNYTLHAFADGVLGEYMKAEVVVEAGKPLDLGRLNWTPVRKGRQVWEIGIPNRNGSEFLKGDDFFHDGMQLIYAQTFPNDVNFVIGQSDYRKDWYYEHVPHATDEALAAAAQRGNAPRLPGESPPANAAPRVTAGAAPAAGLANGGGRGTRGPVPPPPSGRATPWNITFEMPAAVKGKATLRVAFSGTGVRTIPVLVNNQAAGQLGPLTQDTTLSTLGNGIQGIWHENELAFDASLLKPGTNVMTLTIPAGALTAGVIYDYLRLELDESAAPPTAQ